MKLCKKCQNGFEIATEDKAFYEKINVPEPTLCPQCRCQRRMAFRNERHLYQRNCDLCSKKMLSIYEEGTIFPVYCHDCWWSDQWDARTYGQEYNAEKSFFEQAHALFQKVPHLGIITAHCENSEYANCTNYSKNCYLTFGCHAAENCYYGWRMHDGFECMDCLQIDKSKYCYECVDCDECYNLHFSQDCSHCSDSAFLYDCKSSTNCLFSAGLRNKEYCVFNKQYSKEEFLKIKADLDLGSSEKLAAAKEKFKEFLKNYPRRATFIINCENVTGDHIINSKDVRQGFNVKNGQDSAYLESCEDLKDTMDATFSGWPGKMIYESISAGINCYDEKFSSTSWSCNNAEYCDSCHHSKELFGCFGLHNKNEYCILNKQYDEKTYKELKKKIMEDMKNQDQYGEFFPEEMSPFAYNETIANEYFPLTPQQAVAQKFRWKNPNPRDYQPQNYVIPQHIKDVTEKITKETLACEQCKKNYKIITQELELYKKFNLPIPKKCFGCRHQSRINQRNRQKLWNRECSKCQATIQTPYSPERPERIYCEKCYLEETY